MSNGNVFAVTAEQAGALQLKGGDRRQVVFNANNLSGRSLEGRARVVVDMPAQQAWYTVQGRMERKFGVDEVHQFVVEVVVPEGTQEGRYTFALEVDSVERPDEDFGRSENVLVVVSVGNGNGWIPWWVWAAAAGAVVVVGSLIAWIAMRGDGGLALPQLEGQPVETAIAMLDTLGLAADTTLELRMGEDGIVLDQDPDSGAVVEAGVTVTLTVASPAVLMPNLFNNNLQAAANTLNSRGLTNYTVTAQTSQGAGDDPRVISQTPPANDTIALDAPVTVTFGVKPPDRDRFCTLVRCDLLIRDRRLEALEFEPLVSPAPGITP